MQSQRQLKVGEQIRHVLSHTLQRGHFLDPDLQFTSRITVTEVRISPDLKNATAFVMPLGGERLEATIAALNRTAGFFRSELGKNLELRYTPRVVFRADESFANAERIEKMLQDERVQKDLLKKTAQENQE